ncbi:MAG: acyl carrier protein [Bacteroidales bacterium]
MTNIEKYNKAFIEIFDVKEADLPKLTYQSVVLWDSMGHMALITELEMVFNIMIETDDIIDFNSYKKGFEILKRYGIGL